MSRGKSRENQRIVEPLATQKNEELTIQIMEITPDIAKKWLEGHENVREVSWHRVEAFANDMRDGRWQLTHQGICFNANGDLIDGQHRLHAIVRSGKTVRMMVCRTTVGTIKDPIDRGAPRTIATIMGVSNRDTAALNVLRFFEAGYKISSPLTLGEAEEIFNHHKQWIDQVNAIRNKGNLLGGVMASCVWAMPLDTERVLEFAHQVATGEMIKKGDPAFAFRWWRERNKRFQPMELSLACLNCIRYHLNSKQIAAVYFGPSGYRAITTRRRFLNIPFTPEPELVPSMGFNTGLRNLLDRDDPEKSS